MEQGELLRSINNAKAEIEDEEKRLADLKETLEAIIDFQKRCDERAEAFEASVARRRRRLSSIEDLISSMRSAMKYFQKVNSMLTGAEHSDTVASINQLFASISAEKTRVQNEIVDTETRIRNLSAGLSSLQQEYAQSTEEGNTVG